MTSEPIDACAAALCQHNAQIPWAELDEDGRDYYRAAARACLEATLPVSIEMRAAMLGLVSDCMNDQQPHLNAALDKIFTAAIHAITKQED